jgi:hypothetical protein
MKDVRMLIRVSLVLPYLLRIPSGDYPTSAEGVLLRLTEQYVAEENGLSAKRTAVSFEFDADVSAKPDQQLTRKKREADSLLRHTNRLIRWYRSETRQAAVVEVTKVQASPFIFRGKGDQREWNDELAFEADSPAIASIRNSLSVAKAIKAGMTSNSDPLVANLFLLDAEQALRDGRFREAVLFCWSTIDATFNTKYEALVDQVLVGEWTEGCNWLKDNRFGMKNKMTAILFLMTGQSLSRDTGDLWVNLGQSYKKRNRIIHSGETAQEADAELALSVARKVVELMALLKPKKTGKKK